MIPFGARKPGSIMAKEILDLAFCRERFWQTRPRYSPRGKVRIDEPFCDRHLNPFPVCSEWPMCDLDDTQRAADRFQHGGMSSAQCKQRLRPIAAKHLKLRRADDLPAPTILISTRDHASAPVVRRGNEKVTGDGRGRTPASRPRVKRDENHYEEKRPPHRPLSNARGGAFFTYLPNQLMRSARTSSSVSRAA